MFKYIKGLFMKKELLKIQELELENQRLEEAYQNMAYEILELSIQLEGSEEHVRNLVYELTMATKEPA